MPVAARQVLDRVIAGEYAMGINMFNHHAVISAAKAAPVKWLPVSPAMVTMNTSSVMKNAPHPNAARLFVEFNLSDEGQKIYAAAGYIPASPSVPAHTATLKPDAGHYATRIMSPAEFQERSAEWIAVYKRLFQ